MRDDHYKIEQCGCNTNAKFYSSDSYCDLLENVPMGQRKEECACLDSKKLSIFLVVVFLAGIGGFIKVQFDRFVHFELRLGQDGL
uniref:Uncharacterized protein n=1 Tax=Romanomermis culicivorax TaxID=13658 RepID=A0A915HWI5_ROMCU